MGGDRERTDLQARATVGNDREELEALVLGVDGPAFTRARTEGRLLSIAEAAGFDARKLVPLPGCAAQDGSALGTGS
jgi:hypothetical protein